MEIHRVLRHLAEIELALVQDYAVLAAADLVIGMELESVRLVLRVVEDIRAVYFLAPDHGFWRS